MGSSPRMTVESSGPIRAESAIAAALLLRRVICWKQATASRLDVVMGFAYELATPPISASGNERCRAFGHVAHLHRAELPHAQHHACGAVSARRVHGCG